MISNTVQHAHQMVGNAGARTGADTVSPMRMSLLTMDQIIAVLAGAVLLVIVVRRLTRRTVWLEGSPLRPHPIREDAVVMAAAWYLTAVLVLAGIAQVAGLDPNGEMAKLLVGVGAQMVGIVACIVIASRRLEGGGREFLLGAKASPKMHGVALVLCLTFISLGLCPVIAELSVRALTWFDPTFTVPVHPTLLALREKGMPIWLVVALWFGAAGVAPVAEEFFFRGFVQTMWIGVLKRRWVAIALTSMAFGLIHYPQPHAVPALIFLSILLGYSYERTGTLIAPVVIHALFNLKTLLWESLGG